MMSGFSMPVVSDDWHRWVDDSLCSRIGIDFGVPLEERHAGITTGLAPGVVRNQNHRPKGRGARRREARTRKGGKK